MHLPTVHAFRVTANLTSGVATVKPIMPCVSSFRQQQKESSKSHNTFASAKMDSMKLKTELASRVPVDAQDVNQPQNVASVYHKLLSIQTGPAHVQIDFSMVLPPTASCSVNHAPNNVPNILILLRVRGATMDSDLPLITSAYVQETFSST